MSAIECGSIAQAPKKMHVVPSAVPAAVNQVEKAMPIQANIT